MKKSPNTGEQSIAKSHTSKLKQTEPLEDEQLGEPEEELKGLLLIDSELNALTDPKF